MQETHKNWGDKRIASSKLSHGISEEKHTMTSMISVIRNNILYLQTVLIKQPGPASQYRMHVLVHGKFLILSLEKNAGRFRNISSNRNEPRSHKHMTNYRRGVKLPNQHTV